MTAFLGVSLLGVGGVLTARPAESYNEVKMELTDCLKAVQGAPRAATAGAATGDVDKNTSNDGKTVIYEPDDKIDVKTYEIKVGGDGKPIRKKIEEAHGYKKAENNEGKK